VRFAPITGSLATLRSARANRRVGAAESLGGHACVGAQIARFFASSALGTRSTALDVGLAIAAGRQLLCSAVSAAALDATSIQQPDPTLPLRGQKRALLSVLRDDDVAE
jgi:hypothetical protein